MAIVMCHKSNEEVATQLFVPAYQYSKSSGVGDTKVNIGTNNTQDVIIGKNSLIVLIYERKQ